MYLDRDYRGAISKGGKTTFPTLEGIEAIRNALILWLTQGAYSRVRDLDRGGLLDEFIRSPVEPATENKIIEKITLEFPKDFPYYLLNEVVVTELSNKRGWKIGLDVTDPHNGEKITAETELFS